MTNYFISGVWKDTQDRITYVMLHEITNGTATSTFNFAKGEKTSEAEVIKLIKKNHLVHTLLWKYPRWVTGAQVKVVPLPNGNEYLRSNPDKLATDNLDNLIRMTAFI